MTTIDLISEQPYPVRRLGAVVRASSEHPGLLGLYTYRAGQTTIDTTRDQPAFVLTGSQTFSFETDAQGRLVVSVCDVSEPPPPGGGTGDLARSVTKGRITWHFDREAEVGQFVNGDWWVVGPVGIVAIDPPSVDTGGRVRNGSMLNPSPRWNQRTGADSAITAPLVYDPALNVGLGLSPATPLVLEADSSLVSTVSHDGPTRKTLAAEVLTVVAEAPAPDAFRPPWAGGWKPGWTADGLRRDLLRALAPVAGAPRPSALVPAFSQLWWGDQHPGWIATHGFAEENSPTYGRDIAAKIGEAALALHLDYPPEEKEPLLVRFIQLGIDLFGIASDGGHENWLPNGGHASGRKWPILFAGIMLDEPLMVGQVISGSVAFGEDWQTWRVTTDDIGRNGYTAADVGLPEWGIRHRWQPGHDSPSFVAPYRTCCTANAWPGIHLAALLTGGARAAWAHDPFFEYLDRYRRDIFPATGLAIWQLDYVEWVGAMWERYRGTIA